MITFFGEKLSIFAPKIEMKKLLLVFVALSTSVIAQTETLLNEDFNGKTTNDLTLVYEGDASESQIIGGVANNIANKGDYLLLGYKGEQASSAVSINGVDEPSDSIESTFIFGFDGNFADESKINYNAAENKVRVSDARVELNYAAPLYAIGLGDTLHNFQVTTYFDIFNVKSFVQDGFYTGTYNLTTVTKGVEAFEDVPVVEYKNAITVLAYNRDSSVTLLGGPESFKLSACGSNPGFADIGLFQDWFACTQDVDNLLNPYSLTSVVPALKPGIDDVNVTRYYSSGCSDSLALNFNGKYKVDNGRCVLPQDLIDEANAELSIGFGIDTMVTPIAGVLSGYLARNCDLDYYAPIDTAFIADYVLFSANDSVLINWTIEQGQRVIDLETKHAIETTGITKAFFTLYCDIPVVAQTQSLVQNGDYTALTFGGVFNSDVVTSQSFAGSEVAREIVFYPNPVNENGVLHLNNSVSWSVVSLDGKTVSVGEGNQILLSEVAAGTYILNTTEGNKLFVVK